MMKRWILFFALSICIVTVKAQPCLTGTVSANQTICSGSTPNLLSVSGFQSGGHIQWQSSTNNTTFTALLPGDTLANYQPGALTATRYYRVELSAGISGTACTTANSISITINVQNPPTAPSGITGAAIPVCNGASATLTATGGLENSGADYIWGQGGVIGINALDTTDNDIWMTPALTSSTTFWVRRIASSTSACTNTTGGVSQLVTVRPALAVSITDPGELCQLPGQEVLITNETVGQPEVHILWGSFSGQFGSENFTTSVQIPLNLAQASGSSNFSINGFEFAEAPLCTNLNVISQIFDIKPRPAITSILHNDLTSTDNLLCQNYGPVEINVSTPETVSWEGSYFINGNLIEQPITNTPYALQIESTGNHNFEIDSLWYNTGLTCGHDPSDYDAPNVYTYSVDIKPTPPSVELIAGAPPILQFCNYVTPLIVDSVARMNDINFWVVNDMNYNIAWKNAPDNSIQNLNNIPLANGAEYFPVYELDGCQSILNAESPSFLIDLLPLPDLLQSDLLFSDSICSGVPFDILFNPGENISHFSILDYTFVDPLSSANITDMLSFPNIPGSNFSISNSGSISATFTANIYAQNKNVSEINPVTCWAAPIPIEILVNPNATLNPSTSNFESCQNGPNFMIDPGWNGIGEVDWDDPLGIPAPIDINGSTKIITVDMSSGDVPPGVYPIHISGGYPESNCTVDTTFTVSIYASPEIATHIRDIDGTICHNEYTHIQITNPESGVIYQWECSGCETTSTVGDTFLPHWTNPSPSEGNWSDLIGTYSLTATDTTTDAGCTNFDITSVNIIADYASCPEGIDFFQPNGLSLVDAPALYFQWYSVDADNMFSEVASATDQTYFPTDDIDGCDPSRYIVASSLYPDRCWSTTVNCFETFGLRECQGPKSRSFSPEFLLYPNPVTGNYVVLENLNPDLDGRYTIELFDITGKTQFSNIILVQSTNNLLELPELVAGVYLFRISNTKYAQSVKLIIN